MYYRSNTTRKINAGSRGRSNVTPQRSPKSSRIQREPARPAPILSVPLWRVASVERKAFKMIYTKPGPPITERINNKLRIVGKEPDSQGAAEFVQYLVTLEFFRKVSATEHEKILFMVNGKRLKDGETPDDNCVRRSDGWYRVRISDKRDGTHMNRREFEAFVATRTGEPFSCP